MLKKCSLIVMLMLCVPVLALAATRTSAKTEAKKAAKIDYNCSDFSSRAEAQEFFLTQGGPQHDPYRLDADKDGMACEKLK
jgi:hypothetical protein